MQLSILVLCATITIVVSTPISQLFDPFGDFLQGNILKPNDAFYNSAQNFSNFYKQFASQLENEEQMSNILNEFKLKYNKLYEDEIEAELRLINLKSNLLKVFQHNAEANNGKQSYTMTVNQFSDMTIEEIINSVTGYWPSNDGQKSNVQPAPETSYYADTVDFRTGKIVAPIQNQGSCGSCVYFAAAAVVESSWAKRGNALTVLSTQQLNDCAHNPQKGNNGCQHGGGTFVPTFDYIKEHGLTSMQNYPYLARDEACNKAKEAQVVARISSWTPITPHGSEAALQKALEQHGPVAVAIHVSDGWAHYKSGVFDGECSGGRNHAVLLVGYGHDDASNKDYWIVKNQWGDGFGERGYIRMRRNNNNMCDIAGDAVWVG